MTQFSTAWSLNSLLPRLSFSTRGTPASHGSTSVGSVQPLAGVRVVEPRDALPSLRPPTVLPPYHTKLAWSTSSMSSRARGRDLAELAVLVAVLRDQLLHQLVVRQQVAVRRAVQRGDREVIVLLRQAERAAALRRFSRRPALRS
jgi:hypothetical protein